jgi:hypothetical protein
MNGISGLRGNVGFRGLDKIWAESGFLQLWRGSASRVRYCARELSFCVYSRFPPFRTERERVGHPSFVCYLKLSLLGVRIACLGA